jgi:hypothetical protein
MHLGTCRACAASAVRCGAIDERRKGTVWWRVWIFHATPNRAMVRSGRQCGATSYYDTAKRSTLERLVDFDLIILVRCASPWAPPMCVRAIWSALIPRRTGPDAQGNRAFGDNWTASSPSAHGGAEIRIKGLGVKDLRIPLVISSQCILAETNSSSTIS